MESMTTPSQSADRQPSFASQGNPGMDHQNADQHADFRSKLWNSPYPGQSSSDNDNDNANQYSTTDAVPGLNVLGNVTNRSTISPKSSISATHARKNAVISPIVTDITPDIHPEVGIRSPPGLSRRSIVFGDFEPRMAVEDDAAGLAYTDGLWMHSGAGDALIHSPKVNRADDWSIEKFGSKSDDIHADSFDAFNLSADSTIWHEQFQLTPLATQGKSQFETPIALVLTEPTPVREEFDLLEINEPPKQQANSTLAVDTTLIDTTVDCNNLRDIDSELWIPESSGLRRSLRAPPGLSHPSATPLQGSSNNTLSPPGPSTVTRPPPGLTKSRSFGSPLSPQGYPGNLSTLSGSNFPHTDNSNVKKEDDLIMAEEYVGLPASFGIARTTSTPTHGVNSASFQMQQRSLKNSLLTELKESLVSAGSSQSSLAPVENTDISLSPAQNPPRWLFTRNGYKSRWAENVVDRPRNEYLSQEDLDNRRKRYKRLLQRLPALYVYGNEKPPIIEFVGAGW